MCQVIDEAERGAETRQWLALEEEEQKGWSNSGEISAVVDGMVEQLR